MMRIVRDMDMSMTTYIDMSCTDRRRKYHKEQNPSLSITPGFRLLNRFTATGMWMTLESISIEHATMNSKVDRFRFFVREKYFKARQFPGNPIKKQEE